MPGLPVIPPHAPLPSAGLSAHGRHLWRASLRYRLLADALAAQASAGPANVPAAPTKDDSWLAFR